MASRGAVKKSFPTDLLRQPFPDTDRGGDPSGCYRSLEAKQGDKSGPSRHGGWKQTTENLPRCPSAVYLLDSFAGESSKQFIDTITLCAIAIVTTQMKTSFNKIYDASCLPLGRLPYRRLKYKQEGESRATLLSITFKVNVNLFLFSLSLGKMGHHNVRAVAFETRCQSLLEVFASSSTLLFSSNENTSRNIRVGV